MARSGSSAFSFKSKWFLETFNQGIRIGIDKGYQTTPLPKRVKASHRKGVLTQKNKFVRSVIREVAGFSPYERRVMELLRNSKVCLTPCDNVCHC